MNSNEFFRFMPKEPLGRSEFSKKCVCLCEFVKIIFELYKWFGANEEDERVCTLQYLGYKLYRALDMARMLYEERGMLLRDEHCCDFETVLKELDEKVRRINRFIGEADELLAHAYVENSPFLDFGKKRLISKFKVHTTWTKGLFADDKLLALATEKCEHLNMRYDINGLNDINEVFRQQTYSFLDVMILFSLPSHVHSTKQDFAALFQRTFEAFKDSEKWKEYQMCFLVQLDDEFNESELSVEKEWEFLKKKYNELSAKRKDFLSAYDIMPINLSSEIGKATMGMQLYERLNGISLSGDTDKSHKKMSDADLCTYLTQEAVLQLLSKKIEILRPKKTVNEVGAKHYGVFADGVDEDKLAVAVNDVYQCFFGTKKTANFTSKFNKEVDLMAYLFIAFDKLRIGNHNFAERGRKTFYDFCKDKVRIETDSSDRTFYNRLTRNFKQIYNNSKNKFQNMADRNNPVFKDFQTVSRKFQETKYYEEFSSKQK